MQLLIDQSLRLSRLPSLGFESRQGHGEAFAGMPTNWILSGASQDVSVSLVSRIRGPQGPSQPLEEIS